MNIDNSKQAGRSIQQSHSHQQGVTMIDALIALVIFSVGLLALASLQTITKQANYEAVQRSYAATMANGLFERMRMNSASAGTKSTPVSSLNSYVNSTYTLSYKNSKNNSTADCYTVNCTYAQMADWDIFVWWQSLIGSDECIGTCSNDAEKVGGLFQPTVCLTGPGAGVSGEYTLTMAWRGQQSLPDTNAANTCGTGDYGTDNVYRRLLVMSTYLEN